MSVSIREALWDWVTATTSILKMQSPLYRPAWKLNVEECGGFSGEGITVLDVHAIVHQARSALIDLSETAVVLASIGNDAFAANALIRQVENEDDDPKIQQSLLFERCLAPLAIGVFQSPGKSIDMKSCFDQLYQQLQNYIYKFDQLQFKWIIHLTGIKLEMESVDLENHVKLRRAKSEEQEQAYAASYGFNLQPGLREIEPLPPRIGANAVPLAVVEITDNHCSSRQPAFAEPARTIGRRVVESLGLVGEEAVAGHSIWRIDPNVFASVGAKPDWFDNNTLKFLPYPAYSLTHERADLLRQVFPLVELPMKTDRISLARQRLLYSYDREFIVDPIIDCWIGLEALFLPDASAELKFRAALRIAQYLGETREERHELYDLARKSYDARSGMAHGNLKDIQKFKPQMVSATRSLLQRSIRKSLLDNQPPDIKALDEALLD